MTEDAKLAFVVIGDHDFRIELFLSANEVDCIANAFKRVSLVLFCLEGIPIKKSAVEGLPHKDLHEPAFWRKPVYGAESGSFA